MIWENWMKLIGLGPVEGPFRVPEVELPTVSSLIEADCGHETISYFTHRNGRTFCPSCHER